MKMKNVIRIIAATIVILLVPFVVMQVTDEAKWDLGDFIVIGGLLIGAGLMFELVAAKVNKKYRPVVAVMCVIAVVLAWVELAVGIFD